MRSNAELMSVLRARGWKVTPQRLAVFATVRDCGTHPTADEVHALATRRLGTISLRTVYQALHELVELGEVREVRLTPGPARFDPTTARHDHLVCDSCGSIADVVLPPVDHGGELHGFSVSSTDVVVRGTCAACR